MKIELDSHDSSINVINSYSTNGIVVKNILYQNSLIVSPTEILEDWSPQSLTDLTLAHLQPVINLSPEIVLIGTGERLQFPAMEITEAFLGRRIGVEVMDTGAACRAYNFLAGEGRLVIAALFRPGA